MATTEEMRTCRTIGHSWDTMGTSKENRSQYSIILRCERCGTVRNDVIQRSTGELYNRHYDYANGYRDADIVDGTQNDRRAWLLKELLRKDRVALESIQNVD